MLLMPRPAPRDVPGIDRLDIYKANGGSRDCESGRTMKPGELTEMVKTRARARRRIPTGTKWSFIDNKNWPLRGWCGRSEPGTFKDREIMETTLPIPGRGPAAYAGANTAWVYPRR
jgi:NADH:ubiquinone oxidoreductase subunit F (NADH-binding)